MRRNSECIDGSTAANAKSCIYEMTKSRIGALHAVFAAASEGLQNTPALQNEGARPRAPFQSSTLPAPVSPPAVSSTPSSSSPSPAFEPTIIPPSGREAAATKSSRANEDRAGVNEETASRAMLASVETLLKNPDQAPRFFKYTVDKSKLVDFRQDMTILRVVYEEKVFFDTDKSTLRSEATPIVRSVAQGLRRQTGKVALFVAGHTDARGGEQYNVDLSVRRAEAVAQAIKKEGVGSVLIWRVGFGKSLPVRSNDTLQNMAINRRVEFLIATQASIITAWIKSNKGLCEDESCGPPSVTSTFTAAPITSNATSITLDIPTPTPVEIEMEIQPVEIGPPLQ